MKENKLILMQKKVDQMGVVINTLIEKLKQVDQMAKGTLTAFQLNIGKDEWEKIVKELQDVESRPQPEEKKFETDVE